MPPLDILQTQATFSGSEGACFTSNSQESSSMRSQIHTKEISDSGVCFCADMEEGESKLFKGISLDCHEYWKRKRTTENFLQTAYSSLIPR